MAASVVCVVHCKAGEKSELRPISDTNYRTLSARISDWMTLDGVEQEIAQELSDKQGTCPDHAAFSLFCLPGGVCTQCLSTYGYHKACYSKFTDKNRIQQAQKRISKGLPRTVHRQDVTGTADQGDEVNESDTQQLKRTLRSSDPGPVKASVTSCTSEPPSKRIRREEKKRRGVLGNFCIICKKNKYYTESHSKIRRLERLVLCSDDRAEANLTKAAKRKNDWDMLYNIEQGVFAKEAQYHKSCYKTYIRESAEGKNEERDVSYDKAFDQFVNSDVVDRIINQHEVLSMNQLTKRFKATVHEVYGINSDSWTYTNYQLKRRLVNRFPELQFTRQKDPHQSELVVCMCEENQRRLIQESDIFSSSEADTEMSDMEPDLSDRFHQGR